MKSFTSKTITKNGTSLAFVPETISRGTEKWDKPVLGQPGLIQPKDAKDDWKPADSDLIAAAKAIAAFYGPVRFAELVINAVEDNAVIVWRNHEDVDKWSEAMTTDTSLRRGRVASEENTIAKRQKELLGIIKDKSNPVEVLNSAKAEYKTLQTRLNEILAAKFDIDLS